MEAEGDLEVAYRMSEPGDTVIIVGDYNRLNGNSAIVLNHSSDYTKYDIVFNNGETWWNVPYYKINPN
jgi:hypothetical protein